jgi:uncharacterized protein (DUF58 family)
VTVSSPSISQRFGRAAESSALFWEDTAALRAAARERLSIVTPFGWAVAATAVASWVLGNRLGWEELDVIGAGCAAVLLVATVFTLGRSELSIGVRVTPPRVTVGERAIGEVSIRNVSSRRLVPVPVELPVGAGLARFNVPPLAAGGDFEDAFIVPTNRRAAIPVGPARSVRSDPLGLLRREVVFSDTLELFVHPRTALLDPFGSGLLRDLEGNTTEAISPSDLAFHSLRSYVPGDDRRHVHWRTTARLPSGELMVRQFLDTRRSHVVVILDTAVESYATDDEFELAVSAAASFALCGIRGGQEVTAVLGRPVISRGPGATVLDAFSRAESSEKATSVPRLGAYAAEACGDASLVIAVSGSGSALADLRRGLSYFDLDTSAVSVVADLAGPSRIQTSSGTRLLRLASLAELPGLASAVTRA